MPPPETKDGERQQSFAPVEHLAAGCPLTYGSNGRSEQYAAGGGTAPTDGLCDSWCYSARWQGFFYRDVIATVDSGSVTRISLVQADFMQWRSAWIWAPAPVEMALSADGKEFRTVAPLRHDDPPHAVCPEYRTSAWKKAEEFRCIGPTARPSITAAGSSPMKLSCDKRPYSGNRASG